MFLKKQKKRLCQIHNSTNVMGYDHITRRTAYKYGSLKGVHLKSCFLLKCLFDMGWRFVFQKSVFKLKFMNVVVPELWERLDSYQVIGHHIYTFEY